MKINKVLLQEADVSMNTLENDSEDLNQSTDRRQRLKDYINGTKKWDDALKDFGTSEEYNDVVKTWTEEKLKGTNFSDESIDVIKDWIFSFRTFDENKNPFLSYLITIVDNGIKPTEDSLITVNNAYASEVLHNEDLKKASLNPVLKDKNFYNSDRDSQEYYLEIYDFLNDKSNVSKIQDAFKNTLQIAKNRFLGKNSIHETLEMNDISDIIKGKDIIKIIMFDKNGNLKSADDIQTMLTDISNTDGWETVSNNKNTDTSRKIDSTGDKQQQALSSIKKALSNSKLGKGDQITLLNDLLNSIKNS